MCSSQPCRYCCGGSTGPVDALVAEIEFYGSRWSIGRPSLAIGTGANPAAARDGNPATADAALGGRHGFIGVDAGSPRQVSRIRVLAAAGSEQSLRGARLRGSNNKPAFATVISSVATSDGRSVSYEYAAEPESTGLGMLYQLLTGVVYGDGTRADYTYVQPQAAASNLPETLRDPRYVGEAATIRYEYEPTVLILGRIHRELSGISGGVAIASATYGSGTGPQTVTYANGAVIQFERADGGASYNAATRVNGVGAATNYTYDAGGYGLMTSMTNARGFVTSYSRSIYGNPLSVDHPDGTTESFTRDAREQLLTRTLTGPGITPRTTVWTRDSRHRVIRIDHPDSTFETFTYDDATGGFGNVASHRRRNGGIGTFAYDPTGRLIQRTDPLGNVTQMTYNAHDLISSIADPRGNVTQYGYDERGLPTTALHADGSQTATGYDDFANRVSFVNELGNQWTWTFDEFQRLTSATDPLARTTTYGYGIGSNNCARCHEKALPTLVTLPSGKQTHTTYDLEWRPVATTVGFGSPDAATTQTTYDPVGNVIQTTDPLGRQWLSVYDERDRPVSESDPLGHTTATSYDAAGNQLTTTRADFGITTRTFDAMDRLTQETDPKNQTTAYTYHDDDSLASLTDARSNTYAFEVDLLGRRTKMTYPNATFEAWTYQDGAAAGQIATIYRARNAATLSCTFDVRNRDVFCDWSDATPDIVKTYDLAGRLTGSDNGVSALTYAYDPANQMVGETQRPAGQTGWTVGMAYDADGNRASLTYPGGLVVTTSYTGRNQVAAISAGSPPSLAAYTYDRAGNRTDRLLENGTTTTAVYDAANRLTSLTHANAVGTLAGFGYSLDAMGNRTAKSVVGSALPSATAETYAYDAIDQLTQVGSVAAGTSNLRLRSGREPDDNVRCDGHDLVFDQRRERIRRGDERHAGLRRQRKPHPVRQPDLRLRQRESTADRLGGLRSRKRDHHLRCPPPGGEPDKRIGDDVFRVGRLESHRGARRPGHAAGELHPWANG